MTARDQARLGERRLADRDRASGLDAAASPRLGEVLLAARERKGVDLFRAERDTKIRAKYLSALERSDFRELPGAVYTKGFLRNYAAYLGLDPDGIVEQWKRESTGGSTRAAAAPALAPPRPLHEPRRGPVITPGVLVGALLSLAVIAFGIYIVVQLFRFAQPPTLSLSSPGTANFTASADAQSLDLVGRSLPGAVVTIQRLGEPPWQANVTADNDGHWTKQIPLNKDRNDFVVFASDPVTQQVSERYPLIITVPLPSGPAASGSPQPSGPPAGSTTTLEVTSPRQSATSTNGQITVSGRTSAARVTVTTDYRGGPELPAPLPSAVPAPTPQVVAPAPSGASPAPSGASPAPSGASPAPTAAPATNNNAPRELLAGAGGQYSGTFTLAPGYWTLTISAANTAARPVTVTRDVKVVKAVATPPPSGVTLQVEIRKDPAWLAVWVDGVRTREFGGVKQPGTTFTVRAQRSVEVRSGSSGSTFFTLNGVPLGALGRSGIPETWLFEPPAPPQKTQRTR
jgi:hypothetical protein